MFSKLSGPSTVLTVLLASCSFVESKTSGGSVSKKEDYQDVLGVGRSASRSAMGHMQLASTVRKQCKPSRDETKSKLTFAEQPKLQWDWYTDNAGRNEVIPDFIARAFKTGNETCLMLPHSELGILCGRDLGSLSGTSHLAYRSPHNPVWPAYDYKNWVASPFHLGNGKVFALAHSEWYECLKYKDEPNKKCSVGQNQFNSWSNAISSYTSSNSGRSWNRVATLQRPAQLPNTFSSIWPGKLLNHGFFHPGNIITENDYYYAFVKYVSRNVNSGEVDRTGLLLMRTKDLYAQSWEQVGPQGKIIRDSMAGYPLPNTESWDLPTVSFNVSLCKYLLTFWDYNTQTARYVTFDSLENPAFSVVQDLQNQQFVGIPNNERPAGFVAANYPTGQIDPDSLGDNFQFTDDEFFMYLGSFQTSNVLKRSLYRTSLKFVDVVPPSKKAATGSDHLSASLRSVFRYFNGSGHYFSTTQSNSLPAGGSLEGEAFKLQSQSANGLIPLKRCTRSENNQSLLSTMPNCEGFSFDEILGYLSPVSLPGSKALYRCYNTQSARHLSTVHSAECAGSVYIVEGIQGYVF